MRLSEQRKPLLVHFNMVGSKNNLFKSTNTPKTDVNAKLILVISIVFFSSFFSYILFCFPEDVDESVEVDFDPALRKNNNKW